MSTNVLSGARAIFKIGSNKVAFASNVDVSEEVMYEPVDVMDNIEVQEHVPVGYRVTFTCGIFRTVRGTPNATEPKQSDDVRQGMHGSLRQMGIFPQIKDILTSGVLNCTITDRLTNKTIMTLQEAKSASTNYSITARGIVAQNLSFVGIRIADEGSN